MGYFKEMDIDIQECVEDLKMLRGIAPHNHPSNIVYGDGYFAKSLETKYPRGVLEQAEKRLEVECTKLTVRITPAQQKLLANMIDDELSHYDASRCAIEDDSELVAHDIARDNLQDVLTVVTDDST